MGWKCSAELDHVSLPITNVSKSKVQAHIISTILFSNLRPVGCCCVEYPCLLVLVLWRIDKNMTFKPSPHMFLMLKQTIHADCRNGSGRGGVGATGGGSGCDLHTPWHTGFLMGQFDHCHSLSSPLHCLPQTQRQQTWRAVCLAPLISRSRSFSLIYSPMVLMKKAADQK